MNDITTKPGTETSSYRALLLTIALTLLMPLPPLLVAVLLRTSWFPVDLAPATESYLSNLLATAAAAVGLGGLIAVKGIGQKFIEGRSKVSEIKAQTEAKISTGASMPVSGGDAQNIVNVNQGDEKGKR